MSKSHAKRRVDNKYILKSKEALKLLLNIRIILSCNKVQLLQKQQFVNYFVKHLREAK